MSVNVEPGQSSCETREIHSRLMKCALAVEESRAYWQRALSGDDRPVAQIAFEDYWFGAKSLPWGESVDLEPCRRVSTGFPKRSVYFAGGGR